MAQLDIKEIFAGLAEKAEALGLEAHNETRGGQSCIRFQIGKASKDPATTFQAIGAFLTLNLPGDADQLVAAGAETIGLGNSPGSTTAPNA